MSTTSTPSGREPRPRRSSRKRLVGLALALALAAVFVTAAAAADDPRPSAGQKTFDFLGGTTLGLVELESPAALPPASPLIVDRAFTGGIDRNVILEPDGCVPSLSGHFRCAKGARGTIRLQLRLTQSGGALLTARGQRKCTPGAVFAIATRPANERGFRLGPATACAFAVVREQGRTVSAIEWCRKVLLARN
jgi:hypothetical protein